MLGESITDQKCATGDKDKPLKVIEAERPEKYLVCPHCNTEIFEKHTYSDDRGITMRHRDCGGAIEFPETPLDEIASWLRPSVEKARADRKAGRPLW